MPTREEPLQTYYPSCRVRLIVRLEDYGEPSTPEPPAKPSTARAGTKDSEEKLRILEEGGSLVLVGQGDDPSSLGSPQAQMASADDLTHVLDGIVPQTANLCLNGLRTADTATIEIPYRELPVDPRAVRAVGVQLFLGTVSAEDYQRGIEGELRSTSDTVSGIALPRNVVPDEYIDVNGRPRTNLRFEGWVSEWEDAWPPGDVPLVTLECVDNTKLLLDQEAPARLTVDPKQPIDRAVADYLSNFPQFRGLSVEYRPAVDRSKIPVLDSAMRATKFAPKLGPSPTGDSELKVWDYLTDVVGAVGHVIRVQGTRVVIQRPRSLYDARLNARPDDPFRGRSLASGLSLPRRLFVYGRNVEEMRFSRKYDEKRDTSNIECRCYDTVRKKTIVVRYPQKGDRVKKLFPGKAAEQKWQVKVVHGVHDEATLRLIAQRYYEELNRGALIARVISQNLGSLGGGNLDPDALDIQPGDPIDVRILRERDAALTAAEIEDLARTRGAEFMRELGFSERFAQAYQRAVNNIGLQSTFRARTVGYSWDSQSGISIDLELMNYVEVRMDKQLPEGEELTPADVGGSLEPVIVSDEVGAI